jgi:DNA-binding CsgD family transcriptional regulator
MLGKLNIHTQKNEMDSYLRSDTKTNPQIIEDLNIRPETTKLIIENIHKKLHHIVFG